MSRRSPVSLQRQMGRILRDQSWHSAISSPALPLLHEILLIFLLTSISTLHITLPLFFLAAYSPWHLPPPPPPTAVRSRRSSSTSAKRRRDEDVESSTGYLIARLQNYLFERPLVRDSVKEKDSSRTWTRATEAASISRSKAAFSHLNVKHCRTYVEGWEA